MARSGKFSIVLAWINTLGGWEFWNFTAEKTHGEDVSNVQEIQRDIFNDWDNEFITGSTERDVLSLDAAEALVVRSQHLTEQQIDSIKNIRRSIKVIDFVDDFTVIVNKGSFQFKTDGEKLYSLEFTITYPSKIIQSQ